MTPAMDMKIKTRMNMHSIRHKKKKEGGQDIISIKAPPLPLPIPPIAKSLGSARLEKHNNMTIKISESSLN